MSMLSNALAAWLSTFDGLSSQCTELSELSDGVILCEVFSQIAPRYMDLECLWGDARGSRPAHTSNLKHLQQALQHFYQDHWGCNIDDGFMAQWDMKINDEVVEMGHGGSESTTLLCSLVLASVPKSENRADLLHKITNMDKYDQSILTRIMEDVEVRCGIKTARNPDGAVDTCADQKCTPNSAPPSSLLHECRNVPSHLDGTMAKSSTVAPVLAQVCTLTKRGGDTEVCVCQGWPCAR